MTDELTDQDLANALATLADHGRPIFTQATCSLLRVSAHRLRTRAAERAAMPDTPLLISVAQACKRTQLSRSKAYDLVASGTWPSVRVGTRRMIHYAGLLAWIGRQTGTS